MSKPWGQCYGNAYTYIILSVELTSSGLHEITLAILHANDYGLPGNDVNNLNTITITK